jgi:hypothetical protein
MTTVFRKTILAMAVASSALSAQAADVLTFEELGAGLAFFTSNYRGFTFGTNSASTNDWFHTSTATINYVPRSGQVFLATDPLVTPVPGTFTDAQAISNTTAFKFDGAWFSGGDQIRYKLFVGDTLVHTSSSTTIFAGVNTFVPSGFTGFINKVVVVGPQRFYGMDDFTYTLVPEPGTYGLMLAGLLMVGGLVRRRTR